MNNLKKNFVNWVVHIAPVIFILVTFHVTGSSPQRLPPLIPPRVSNLLNSGTAPPSAYTNRRSLVLNQTLGLIVSWEPNRTERTILFNISIPMTGNGRAFVFGLSKKGQVEGSDVVVIGLNGQGRPFILDMYGTSNNSLSVDDNQSWNLDGNGSRTQNGTLTIGVTRPLDTCDDQDILINDDMVHLMYGFIPGNVSNSTRTVPFTSSGSSRVYLLDPAVRQREDENVQSFRISRRMQLPARRTSYWCTIHKGPSLPRKHHIIGFTTYFGDENALRHVHHQVVYRCIAPPTVDPSLIFQRYVNDSGEECYLEQRHRLPTLFCTEIVYTFGLGGTGYTFPDNVGIVLGETTNEYYMLETHYDNPDSRSDLVFENGVDFQYSSRVRPVDGGILLVGTGILGLHVIPPGSKDFTQIGQCGSECSRQVVPLNGMQIMGAMLHSHTASVQMRLKHYRGNREFPFVSVDNNYDFSFQQIRHVVNASLVLPGDRILVECTLDTSSRNTTTLSGFSTRDEMCVSFLVVNKRLPYLYCLSEYPTERTMEKFGIQNMTWHRELQERIVNQATDQSYVGQTLGNVIDNNYEWTEERRAEVEREQYSGKHDSACPPVRRMAIQAYFAYFVEGLTGGLLSLREQIENNRPSLRTVWTPQAPEADLLPQSATTTQVPAEVAKYIQPEPCTEIIT